MFSTITSTMNFYCIVSSLDTPKRREEKSLSLAKGCADHGVLFIELDAERFAPGRFEYQHDINLLYRTSLLPNARRLEKYLCGLGAFTMFHSSSRYCFASRGPIHLCLFEAGLPTIPTFFYVPKKKKDLLECVEQLGGFPVVLKASGYYEGVGVMRANSIETLLPMVQYLRASGAAFSLRKFIPHKAHARVTVVGDRVVCSYENKVMEGEFRSNIISSSKENFYTKHYSKELEQLALDAVKVSGIAYGGVDILLSDEGGYYISEINFPSNFAYAEKVTGVHVGGEIVKYLKEKALSGQK